jgi:homocysteine S-methyltransferase
MMQNILRCGNAAFPLVATRGFASAAAASATATRRVVKTDPFAPFLAVQKAVVLDGGLSTALPEGSQEHPMWGCQLLFNADGGLDALKAVHRTWLDNGADVIGTLTYKLSADLVDGSRELGMLEAIDAKVGHVPVEALFRRAVGAAVTARDEYVASNPEQFGERKRPRPLVFASIGPAKDATTAFVGATDPNTRSRGDEETVSLKHYYQRQLGHIFQPGADTAADGVAVETLAGSVEALAAAECLLEAMQDEQVPLAPGCALISFCCDSGSRTTSGESLGEVVTELVSRYPTVVSAVGVNCISPAIAQDCVSEIRDALVTAGFSSEISVAVYPNSGEVWDAAQDKRCWHDGGHENEGRMKFITGDDALAYYETGATLIGGCCRVTPEQIGMFKQALS